MERMRSDISQASIAVFHNISIRYVSDTSVPRSENQLKTIIQINNCLVPWSIQSERV